MNDVASHNGGCHRRYRAAAIQFDPLLGAKNANLAALTRLTEQAIDSGARLIVLPEMAPTGYCWQSRDEIAPMVEPIPGPTTDHFVSLAAKSDAFIVVGMAELEPATGIAFNSAVLIGPSGIVGLYRKTHLYISDPKWAKAGDLGLPVFATELGNIGMAICMDMAFPEAVRVPAVHGADLLAVPTNWLSEKSPSPTFMARAAESGVYVIGANRYGIERGVQFSGGSAIINPDGSIQQSRDTGDGVVIGEIDLDAARDKRLVPHRSENRIADRRPDDYGDLALSSHLWNPRAFHGLYGYRPLPPGRLSQAAVIQQSPLADYVDGNIEGIVAVARNHLDLDLLIFPELSVSGPIADRARAVAVAEPIPGPTTRRLTAAAAAAQTWIVAGMVETDGDDLYNVAVLLGPDGYIGHYRKLHLADADRTWATPGNRGLPTFDLPIGRVGLLIGYDLIFPEAARILAIAGADLIACPSHVDWPPVMAQGPTTVPFPPHVERAATNDHFHLWRERSRENNTYIAFANWPSPAMGWSGIFGPELEELPRREAVVAGSEPGMAALEIDTTNLDSSYPTNVVRAKDLLQMRLPIWYDALLEPIRSTLVTHRNESAATLREADQVLQ